MTDIKEFVLGFVGIIVGITIAVTLLPVISEVIATANITGTAGLMLGMITLLVSIGIVLFAVKALY